MSNFNATGIIINNTAQQLTLAHSSLSWGSWAIPPQQTIPAKSTVSSFLATGGWASGAQGLVVYIIDASTSVTLCFDDPFSGSNNTDGTSISNPAQYNVSAEVPSRGGTVNFTYTIDKIGP